MSSTTPPLARADGVELIEVEGKKRGRESSSGPGLSPSIPDRSKRLHLGFPGWGAVHSCSESLAVEPGEGQMGNVGQ